MLVKACFGQKSNIQSTKEANNNRYLRIVLLVIDILTENNYKIRKN